MFEQAFLQEVQDSTQKIVETDTENFFLRGIITDPSPAKDLADEDYSGVDASRFNKSGVMLSATDPICPNLSAANMQYTNLRDADLSHTDLQNAQIIGVYLNGVNLSNANLSAANMQYIDLRGANLSHTNLQNAQIMGVYFNGANLSNANLICTNLSYASLTCTNLANASLCTANLSHASLFDANLSNANLRYTDLSNANLSNANLRYTDLSHASLKDAKVENARFRANVGLDEEMKFDLKRRGAIFEDEPLMEKAGQPAQKNNDRLFGLLHSIASVFVIAWALLNQVLIKNKDTSNPCSRGLRQIKSYPNSIRGCGLGREVFSN